MRAEFYYGAVMLMRAGALNCQRTLMQNPKRETGNDNVFKSPHGEQCKSILVVVVFLTLKCCYVSYCSEKKNKERRRPVAQSLNMFNFFIPSMGTF